MRIRHLPPLLPLATLLLACGGEPTAEENWRAFEETALADLSTAAPRVRVEVLRTCDKWRHVRTECDADKVHRDSLECWMSVARPELDRQLLNGIFPRSRDHQALRYLYVCMNGRGWQKHKRAFEF